MKEVSASLISEIECVEKKIVELAKELAQAKNGNKAATQRFRVKSVALEKLFKQLRKSTIANG